MRKKYTITLLVLSIMIICHLFLIVSYQNYQKNKKDSSETLVLVKQGLSINFLESNNIKDKNGTFPVTIINTTTQNIYYSIYVNDLKKEYDAQVQLSKNNDKPIQKSLNKKSVLMSNQILIGPGETQNYTIDLMNNGNDIIEGKIQIEVEERDDSFAAKILKNNLINETESTKIGNEVALNNEGLLEMSDELGSTYFFRGNIQNNYVDFAGNIWRIVSINGDRTVKLVLDSSIGESNFQNNNQDVNTDFKTSNINNILNKWYEENLKTYDKYIKNQNFCTDDSLKYQEGEHLFYNIGTRLFVDNAPVMSCLGTSTNNKIGLLSLDEVVLAGATNKENNEEYYLYNKAITNSWWTLSPQDKLNNAIKYYTISKNGQINNGELATESRIIRPVINLVKSTFVQGDGTINNPYRFTTS